MELILIKENIVSDETEILVEKGRQITRRTIICESVKTTEELEGEALSLDKQILELQTKKAEVEALTEDTK